jgi:hypothetical protein
MTEIYLVVKLGNTDIRYFHGSPTMNEAGYRETVKELNDRIEPATFRYILCDDNGDEIVDLAEGRTVAPDQAQLPGVV